MSYSLSAKSPKAEVGRAVTDAIDTYMPTIEASEWQPAEEVRTHLAAVAAAASELASAIGLDSDELSVSVSGHANPGHGPKDGYADEWVTVSVVVVRS
jgi:hypothetical protein